MSAPAVRCPECGGRVRVAAASGWQPCPHCRAAFRPDDAEPLPDPPAETPAVVFEEVRDPAPPAPKRRARSKPRAERAGRPKPPRRPKSAEPAPRRSKPGPAATRAAPPRALPPRTAVEPATTLADAPPAAPRSPRRPRKRRRLRAPGSATVGFWIVTAITLALIGADLNAACDDVTSGEGLGVIDGVRWLISAFLLLKIWDGRNWARVTLVVLMTFGALALLGLRAAMDRAVRENGGRLSIGERREIWEAMELCATYAAFAGVLVVALCTPWVGAFLARQRGED